MLRYTAADGRPHSSERAPQVSQSEIEASLRLPCESKDQGAKHPIAESMLERTLDRSDSTLLCL